LQGIRRATIAGKQACKQAGDLSAAPSTGGFPLFHSPQVEATLPMLSRPALRSCYQSGIFLALVRAWLKQPVRQAALSLKPPPRRMAALGAPSRQLIPKDKNIDPLEPHRAALHHA
jgi:hypothetical protein